MSDLDRRLLSVARRLRAARALEDSARFGLLVAPLGLGVAFARVVFRDGGLAALPIERALLLAFAPAVAGAALGALAGALRPISKQQAASLAEERAALGAAFTTALEVALTAHAWRGVVLAEADELARSMRPAAVAPLGVPRRTRPLFLVLATTLALLFLPVERLHASAPEPTKKVEKPALEAIAKAGAQLRESSQALPQGEARRSIDESGKQLRTFLTELEAGELGKREALARLGDAEEQLRAERGREEARRAVREGLGRDADLKPLARAGAGTGTPDKAKLDALAEKLAKDPAAREKARAAVESAAHAASPTPALQEALEKAQRALEATHGAKDAAKLAPALDELARAMATEPSREQDRQAKTELAKAQRSLDEARAAVTGEKPPEPAPEAPEPPSAEELAQKIPPELVSKALAQMGEKPSGEKATGEKPAGETPAGEKTGEKPAGEKPPVSPEDAKKLLDKLSPETLAKLAKAAQEAAPGKMDEAAQKLDEDVKKDLAQARKDSEPRADEPRADEHKDDEEHGIPPEALAKMAEMIPPELIAKALKMKAQSEPKDGEKDGGASQPPPISPEDAQKVLEKLSPKTLEKLAKAAMEAQKDAPPRSSESGPSSAPRAMEDGPKLSPEQANEIVKKLSPATLSEIQRAAGSAGALPPPRSGGGPGDGEGVLGRQGESRNPETARNPDQPPRVSSPEEPPLDDAALVKNKSHVAWDRSPDQLPREARGELRAALERRRVPRAYEKSVREYFDLGNK